MLTHLHLDHLQGLGFFRPLFVPGLDIHIWGPTSPVQHLAERIAMYLSPPLFPVRLEDVPSNITFHDAPEEPVTIGSATIRAAKVLHQGPTVGYRIEEHGRALVYLPDHEPSLGADLATMPDGVDERPRPRATTPTCCCTTGSTATTSTARTSGGATRASATRWSSRTRRTSTSSCCSITTRITPTRARRAARRGARTNWPGHGGPSLPRARRHDDRPRRGRRHVFGAHSLNREQRCDGTHLVQRGSTCPRSAWAVCGSRRERVGCRCSARYVLRRRRQLGRHRRGLRRRRQRDLTWPGVAVLSRDAGRLQGLSVANVVAARRCAPRVPCELAAIAARRSRRVFRARAE